MTEPLPNLEYAANIAFAGDWHGNLSWAIMMIDQCEEEFVTHIFHTGDYGFTFSRSFIDGVEAACKNTGIKIYFVDGNHDDHDWIWHNVMDEDGFYVVSDHVRAIPRGKRWTVWRNTTFMGLGGATSVDRQWRTPMVGWWPTESLTNADIQRAIGPGKVDVMIAHDCPSGVPIPGITRENGAKLFPINELIVADGHRATFREIVNEVDPALYVHGHYHRDYNWVDPDTGTRYRGLDMDATSWESNIWIATGPWDLERATNGTDQLAGERRDGDPGIVE